jgi:protein-histidine pros-kinase
VFDSAPDGVIITDQQGTILLVKSSGKIIWLYKKRTCRSKIELVIPKDFILTYRTSKRLCFSIHPKRNGRQRALGSRKDGTEFAVEISLSPINLENKTLISAA